VNWQQVLSLLIVAVAATALVWAKWRRRKFRFDRDTACGCAGHPPLGGGPAIVFHACKGQRPVVRLKLK
jgi:hypothetical protein